MEVFGISVTIKMPVKISFLSPKGFLFGEGDVKGSLSHFSASRKSSLGPRRLILLWI